MPAYQPDEIQHLGIAHNMNGDGELTGVSLTHGQVDVNLLNAGVPRMGLWYGRQIGGRYSNKKVPNPVKQNDS